MSGLSRVLKDRNAGAYLGAVLVSGFGSSAMMLAAGVWVMDLTGSAGLAAWVSFLVWAPTLAGPVIGALVDRVPQRRQVMIWSNVGVGLALLALLPVRTQAQIWVIFVVMLIYGVSFVVLDAAETAVLPAAISADLLGDVNGLRMSASEGMKLAAPLAGAGLFTWLGGPAVAALDALTFAVTARLCLLIRPGRITYDPETTPWRQRIAEGGRRLGQHPVLRRLVLSGTAVMFAAGVGGSAVFALVDLGLHRPPAFVGVLSAVQGAGSVMGGFLAGPVLRTVRPHVFVGISIALVATGIALRATPVLSLVLLAGALSGTALPWVLIAIATTVQRDIPAEYLGRVAGTVQLLTFAPNAVGQAVGAALLAVVDYRLMLAGAAVVGAAAAIGCLRPVQRAAAGVGRTVQAP